MRRHWLFFAILALVGWLPTGAQAQGALHRLAASFAKFDNTEFSTSLAPGSNGTGGILIYNHQVTVPTGDNVIYVTISGTGDTHSFSGPNSLLVGCLIGTTVCRGGSSANGAPSGWVNLQTPGADLHDNGVYYTWCRRTTPGFKNVNIRLASANGVDDVFLESLHYYIDSSKITSASDQCSSDSSAPVPAGVQ